MEGRKSASDVSREKFAEIELLLRTGCQWRFLPNDFPKWPTVYAYFMKWSQPDQYGVSALEQALKNQVSTARTKTPLQRGI
jgi:transposase